ncbi:MAG: glycosyltransferase family 2 protein [Candidatus Omnitrophota bacterium]
MDNLKFSVCVPTYNRAGSIGGTIKSVLNQTYNNFELIISDNDSRDNTGDVVKGFKDTRIKYFKNEKNLGFARNLALCKERSSGDILYFVSAKNIIDRNSLLRINEAFQLENDIGAVVIPYYWHGENAALPVRAKKIYDTAKNSVMTIRSPKEAVMFAFSVVDNPSAVAYKTDFMDLPFNGDPFVEFTYPFAGIFKRRKIVFMKDYLMTCPAFVPSGSQKKSVYKKSPMRCWIDLFDNVFPEAEFADIRRACIKDLVAVNYIGLVQVKNYGGLKALLREIFYLVKYRWQNVFSFRFWFFTLGTMLVPGAILRRMAAGFKSGINSRLLKDIKPIDE